MLDTNCRYQPATPSFMAAREKYPNIAVTLKFSLDKDYVWDGDRGSYVKGSALWSATEIAKKILAEHGDVCDTYKLAASFLADWDKLVEKYSDGVKLDTVAEDNEYDFDQEADELSEEFLKDLKEEYRSILSKQYDYLTSEEAIQESIEASEVEFLEDGTRA